MKPVKKHEVMVCVTCQLGIYKPEFCILTSTAIWWQSTEKHSERDIWMTCDGWADTTKAQNKTMCSMPVMSSPIPLTSCPYKCSIYFASIITMCYKAIRTQGIFTLQIRCLSIQNHPHVTAALQLQSSVPGSSQPQGPGVSMPSAHCKGPAVQVPVETRSKCGWGTYVLQWDGKHNST